MSDQQLSPVNCPQCGQLAVMHTAVMGRPKSATSYKSCLRSCEKRGIGFSNVNISDIRKLTLIFKNPLHNIPGEVRAGALEALGNAVNIQNRKNKLKKFAFSTSEDAITWTVFRALQLTDQLRDTFSAVGLLPAQRASAEPALLLWGVPVPESDSNGRKIADRLTDIARQVKDDPQSRSEPDVVLDFGDPGSVVIEVKHRSPNEIKPANYDGWGDYLGETEAFADPAVVAASGLYELARNWRIAWDLAGNRDFSLVNLGPPSLFDTAAPQLEGFIKVLPAHCRNRFVKLRWDDLIRSVPKMPGWLGAFLDARGVR